MSSLVYLVIIETGSYSDYTKQIHSAATDLSTAIKHYLTFITKHSIQDNVIIWDFTCDIEDSFDCGCEESDIKVCCKQDLSQCSDTFISVMPIDGSPEIETHHLLFGVFIKGKYGKGKLRDYSAPETLEQLLHAEDYKHLLSEVANKDSLFCNWNQCYNQARKHYVDELNIFNEEDLLNPNTCSHFKYPTGKCEWGSSYCSTVSPNGHIPPSENFINRGDKKNYTQERRKEIIESYQEDESNEHEEDMM